MKTTDSPREGPGGRMKDCSNIFRTEQSVTVGAEGGEAVVSLEVTRRVGESMPHYEVRLDGRPLDPMKARLLASALVAMADEADRATVAATRGGERGKRV